MSKKQGGLSKRSCSTSSASSQKCGQTFKYNFDVTDFFVEFDMFTFKIQNRKSDS